MWLDESMHTVVTFEICTNLWELSYKSSVYIASSKHSRDRRILESCPNPQLHVCLRLAKLSQILPSLSMFRRGFVNTEKYSDYCLNTVRSIVLCMLIYIYLWDFFVPVLGILILLTTRGRNFLTESIKIPPSDLPPPLPHTRTLSGLTLIGALPKGSSVYQYMIRTGLFQQ